MDNSRPLDQPLLPLRIEKLVYGGDGLARTDAGEVVFVPYACPGDQVDAVKIPGSKPTRAKLAKLVAPSTDRVEPKCNVFGECGGCQWQHVKPTSQRDWKRKIVEESLQRIGGLQGLTVNPTWFNPEEGTWEWEYRNRAQWDVSVKDARVVIGYTRSMSHDVVPFNYCHIIHEGMNGFYQLLSQTLQNAPFCDDVQLRSALKRFEISQNERGELLLVIETKPSPAKKAKSGFKPKFDSKKDALRPSLTALAQHLKALCPSLKGVVRLDRKNDHRTLLLGEEALTYAVSDQRYQVSAGSFFQTNRPAVGYMIGKARRWLPEGTISLLDLYAGVGTFALALCKQAQQVSMVENTGSAIHDARVNVGLNTALNVAIHEGRVETILEKLAQNRITESSESSPESAFLFDAALLDPPRSGCSPDVLAWLSVHVRERLLYLSCNPTTLARDLKQLAATGWKIDEIQPIDMFPQTYHVETMVQLSRASVSLAKDN